MSLALSMMRWGIACPFLPQRRTCNFLKKHKNSIDLMNYRNAPGRKLTKIRSLNRKISGGFTPKTSEGRLFRHELPTRNEILSEQKIL